MLCVENGSAQLIHAAVTRLNGKTLRNLCRINGKARVPANPRYVVTRHAAGATVSCPVRAIVQLAHAVNHELHCGRAARESYCPVCSPTRCCRVVGQR
jgi:hypothetical protein